MHRALTQPLIACVVALATDGLAPAAEPPLRTVAELLAVAPAELDAGEPVRARGVVTLARPDIVINDDTGGIWIRLRSDLMSKQLGGLATTIDGEQQRIQRGDVVEVEGILERGGYAPTIASATARIVGRAPLPEPVDADVTWLFHGGGNALRVVVGRDMPAIVQGSRDKGDNWNLILDASDRRLIVRIDKMLMPEPPDHLVDASVRVVGVTSAMRNSRGQLIAPNLIVADPADIEVVDPPPSSPFDAPFVPLAELGLYSPLAPSRRRIRSEGVVTCHVRGRFCYLQEGLVGVRVDCPTARDLEPGDRVRVAGFIDSSQDIARLVEAVVERIARTAPPSPQVAAPDAIRELLLGAMQDGRIAKPTNYAGVLIHFPAQLVESKFADAGWTLTLTSGQSTLSARLTDASAEDTRRLRGMRIGSHIMATGVAQLETRGLFDILPAERGPETGAMSLLLRSAADVVVTRPPPVWTARFLTGLSAALAAIAGIAIVAIAVLRREVTRQTGLAVAEAAARQAATLEYEISLRERSRIAVDLHDTLLQTMTGIGYQLQLCRAEAGPVSQPDTADHLDTAERLVDHAARQLRSTVWSLRSMPDLRRPFPDAVAALLDSLVGGQKVLVHVETVGEPCPVHETVARQVLLVIQEAALNAVHHGVAQTIDVTLSFAADAAALNVTVADDGRGFVVGSQPGPATGHFGIQGMRERVDALGGRLELVSTPGRGTTVGIQIVHPGRCPAELALHPAAPEATA